MVLEVTASVVEEQQLAAVKAPCYGCSGAGIASAQMLMRGWLTVAMNRWAGRAEEHAVAAGAVDVPHFAQGGCFADVERHHVVVVEIGDGRCACGRLAADVSVGLHAEAGRLHGVWHAIRRICAADGGPCSFHAGENEALSCHRHYRMVPCVWMYGCVEMW